MLMINSMAVGICIYRSAETLNVFWFFALALWVYNAWNGYRSITSWLNETQHSIDVTVELTRNGSRFDREEILN